jgi:outer membrane protein OmpA-like peptidoglycan-associated protein
MLARMKALAFALLAIGPVLVGASARAQEAEAPPQPALNVQRFQPAANYHDFVSVEAAALLPGLALALEFTLSYAHRPLQMSGESGDRQFGVVEGLSSGHFRVGFGLAEWVQVDLRIPVLQLTQVGLIGDVGGNRVHFSLGDLLISSKMRLYKNDAGAAISALPFMTFPIGRRALHLTYGVPTFGAKAAFSTWTKRVHASAHIGYRFIPGSAVVGSVAVDDELLYGAGVGVALARDLLDLNLELVGIAVMGPARWNLPSSKLRFGVHSPLEVNANIRVSTLTGLDFLIGGGVGLSPGVGTPVARAFLGLGWAPPTVPPDDPDRDGVLTSADQCPRQAEDMDGFEDSDGCPDLDNDQDGVSDRADSCPDVAEDLDGFEDSDGCPDLDNDGDGVPDEQDRCPNQGAVGDVPVGADGCPPVDIDTALDTDKDGVVDTADLCPNSAEDRDGFEDEDGCPDPDNDQDGIADLVDVCPDLPEEFNGVDDEDGCPDSVQAIVRGQKIVILRRILFVTNRADILEDSFEILDAVRDTMEQNLQILRLRVDGHSDSRGDPDHNLELSEARARSVMNYLIDAGVQSSRLEATGFGEVNPIADNNTAEGRKVNRRVEFSIVETEGGEEIKVETGNGSDSTEEDEPVPEAEEAPAEESGG